MKKIKFIFYKSIRFFKNIYVFLLLSFFAILFGLIGYYKFFYQNNYLNANNLTQNYYFQLSKKLKINIEENNLNNEKIKNIIIKKTSNLNFWLTKNEEIFLYSNAIYIDNNQNIKINKTNFFANFKKIVTKKYENLTFKHFLNIMEQNFYYLKLNFGFFLLDNQISFQEKPLKINFYKKFSINKKLLN